MQNLTDHPSVEKYSDQFADIIINDFFINKEHVSGQELLDITPLKQVNLFIIKTLLAEWKKESENLRSPYFDFSNDEVQKALATFMNVVSRHISVDEESLKPLLKKAVYDSIHLIFFPYVFYTSLIEDWDEEELTLNGLKQINKYIKVNQSLMNSLIAEVENRGISSLSKKEALELFNAVVEQSDLTPEDTEEFEYKFDQVLSFRLNAFTRDEENLTSNKEAAIASQQAEPEIEESPADDFQPEMRIEENDEEAVTGEDQAAEEDDNFFKENTSEEKATVTLLHDTFQEKEKTTLADLHERQKIEKISKYISINQKFMFINRLFDKDWGKFEKAIAFLDETNDKEEISQYLDANAPAWREEGEEADEFRLVLEKKLGQPIE